MLAVEMLPAGHGDALVVEYGTRSKTHRILVDAGTLHTWEAVRARLLRMPDTRYEAFVITHVDEDHIGGAVQLLADPDLRHRVRDVWFNGFVHSKRGGNVLGPVDGERLTLLIREGGFAWNEPFPRRVSAGVGGPAVVASIGELPRLDLPRGARLHLLSPSGPKLKAMAAEWEKVVIEANLVPGKGTDRPARKPPRRSRDAREEPLELSQGDLERIAAGKERDHSEANGSSIAFILEYDGKRALLGADAHPDVLVPNLKRFGAAVGEERVRIDLCKLPHHASRANVTTDFVGAMDAARYLVSTNGDNFAHPDDAALARIILASRRKPTIYCNYASTRTVPWVERAASVGAVVKLPRTGASGLRVTA
jgi:beta-lactamase superfamily II metal-dependent hydrolase